MCAKPKQTTENTSENARSQVNEYSTTDGLLVVNNLSKQFGGLTAVDNLSFTVKRQEILGFIGPNGAGKSTTFNCITGKYKPTSGTIWFNGEDITAKPPHEIVNRGLNRTFQTFAPLEDRTVLENVELALVPNKLFTLRETDGNTQRMATAICTRVGLGDELEKTPAELPHAGLIRLELARAIATDPDLLLVDEAFAGLVTAEVQEISGILESLRENGMTLVVVDHNMRGLLNLIDRAFVIQFGAKIAEGSPEQIKNDPKVQEAYLRGGNE